MITTVMLNMTYSTKDKFKIKSLAVDKEYN